MDRNEYALNKIKEIYRDKKLTINDFSDLIGKSRSAWLRRESGEVPLTVNEIEEIAQKLGSDFGTITHSSVINQINSHKNFVANNAPNATITIQLTQDQLNKVIEVVKEN
jgi:transcriptional regulator with XRE-family HTH domain